MLGGSNPSTEGVETWENDVTLVPGDPGAAGSGRSAHTLRFEIIHRAGRLVRPEG